MTQNCWAPKSCKGSTVIPSSSITSVPSDSLRHIISSCWTNITHLVTKFINSFSIEPTQVKLNSEFPPNISFLITLTPSVLRVITCLPMIISSSSTLSEEICIWKGTSNIINWVWKMKCLWLIVLWLVRWWFAVQSSTVCSCDWEISFIYFITIC